MTAAATDLTGRIKRGDDLAVEKAYDAYFTQLLNFVYYSVYDYHAALDICQEAFIRVVASIRGGKSEVRDFKAYLFATARNLAMDELKRSSRFVEYSSEKVLREDPNIFTDPARSAVLAEQRAQVASAVSKLNEHQRTALVLKDIDGWSYGDIGSLMGLSRNAVGVLLSRARLKFRREYRLQQIDSELLASECRDLLPVMSAVLDGEASAEEKDRLQAHLATCAFCRETMDEMAGAATTVRSLVPLAPVIALKAALISKALVAGAGAGAVTGGGAGIAGSIAVGTAAAGMSAVAKVVIGIVAAALVAGGGVGVYVGVSRATAPSAAVVEPVDGSTVEREVGADGSATVGILLSVKNGPRSVELEVDGQVVRSFGSGPYSCEWTTGQAGSHSIRPVAFDTDGKRHEGDPVTFTLALEKRLVDGAACVEGDIFDTGGDVYTAAMDGTSARKVTSRGDVVDLAASPVGGRLAFLTKERVMFIMNADGSGVSQVTLPEKGEVVRFTFDKGEKYIYFTRIDPENLAKRDSGNPFDIRFERYDIAANSVALVYVKEALQDFESVGELFADPSGKRLFFNFYGSEYTASEVRVLELGPPVVESEFMPREMNVGESRVVGYMMTGLSSDAGFIAYEKETLNTEGHTVSFVCVRPTAGGQEQVLATNDLALGAPGGVENVQFSVLDPTVYFYVTRTPAEGRSDYLSEFFRSNTSGGPPEQAGLQAVAVAVWHPFEVTP